MFCVWASFFAFAMANFLPSVPIILPIPNGYRTSLSGIPETTFATNVPSGEPAGRALTTAAASLSLPIARNVSCCAPTDCMRLTERLIDLYDGRMPSGNARFDASSYGWYGIIPCLVASTLSDVMSVCLDTQRATRMAITIATASGANPYLMPNDSIPDAHAAMPTDATMDATSIPMPYGTPRRSLTRQYSASATTRRHAANAMQSRSSTSNGYAISAIQSATPQYAPENILPVATGLTITYMTPTTVARHKIMPMTHNAARPRGVFFIQYASKFRECGTVTPTADGTMPMTRAMIESAVRTQRGCRVR